MTHDIAWEFPRLWSCHEGIAFGDARTGVLVWGGGDEIRLTIGRSDLWDHRGGYAWMTEQNYADIVALACAGDKERLYGLFKKSTPQGEPQNPALLPFGRIIVKVPGRTLKRGNLDPFTGLGSLEFVEGGKVSLAMTKRNGGTFAMKFPEGVAFEARSIPATDFPVYGEWLRPLSFEKAMVFDEASPGSGGFSWNLPADEPAWLSWAKTGDTLCLTTGRGAKAAMPTIRPFNSIANESREDWRRFWSEGARVRVPDPVIQRVFDYGMYRFGAMTDPGGVPAGLQGVWFADDSLVPWNGDYHFNINVQECYSPAYRGGHFQNLLPLFRMILGWRPLLRDNARKFAGVENGYVLPHSVDDRGVCIGGWWTGTIDHGSTAWVAAMMMRYVRYSGDLAFLKEGAYDFMKGAMNVYRALMEDDGVALSIPLAPSPEWGGTEMADAVGRDPSFQLAAAHRLARDLVDAARLLGEEPSSMWLDVEKRLPPYSAGENGIDIFKGRGLTESHRHLSHMAGFYPFDTLDISAPETRSVAEKTYGLLIERGTGLWAGWSVPWASILSTHVGNAQDAAEYLHAWEAYFCNAGHGSHINALKPGFSSLVCFGGAGTGGKIMQMDAQCGAAAAVLEMMAHDVNGKTEFFRGCPESWREVSFENIALSDGRRVSGRRIDGEVVVWECRQGQKGDES